MRFIRPKQSLFTNHRTYESLYIEYDLGKAKGLGWMNKDIQIVKHGIVKDSTKKGMDVNPLNRTHKDSASHSAFTSR